MWPFTKESANETTFLAAMNNLNERLTALENAAKETVPSSGGLTDAERAVLKEAGSFFGVVQSEVAPA